MVQRSIGRDLQQRLTFFPAVALLDPLQVGKTTLAKVVQRELGGPSVYCDLERASDLARFQHDLVFFLG